MLDKQNDARAKYCLFIY